MYQAVYPGRGPIAGSRECPATGQAEQVVAFYCAGTRSALSVGSMSVASGIVQLTARGESEKDCVSGPGYHEP